LAVVSVTKISAPEPANYRISRGYFHSRLKPRDRQIIGDATDQTSDLLAIAEAKIAQLQAALDARDRFLSIAAHELRNPMQPLVLQVGLLLKSARRGDADRVVEGLELLETIVARYVKRANVLLDVTRLAADRVALEPDSIDLAECVRKVVHGFTPMAAQAGCALRLSAPQTIPCVHDPMAIEQILENLISNAIKFGADQPIDVAIAVDGGRIALSVRDRGSGIAMEDQPRIFAPFEKVMARAEGGGFGVGLWVVGRLVKEMDGTIELDSSPGNGATFRVSLPLIRDNQDEDERTQS
jgi:two-component system, OmpR family, sensor kinase